MRPPRTIGAPRVERLTEDEIQAGIAELRERRTRRKEQMEAICGEVRREVEAWVKRFRHSRRWAA